MGAGDDRVMPNRHIEGIGFDYPNRYLITYGQQCINPSKMLAIREAAGLQSNLISPVARLASGCA